MDERTRANRAIWDAWVTHDVDSDHHKDVERFRATGSSLRPIERRELGDVTGKTLLHLLCNMGGETLSWARLGARVTGVDFSAEAVARARQLAAEAGWEERARFLCADVYALPGALGGERFDIVFASYGVLFWLPDLDRFARLVTDLLVPGGTLYLLDMHPATNALRADPADPAGTTFQVATPYFHTAGPELERVRVTVDAGDTGEVNQEERALALWSHGLGEALTALVNAGLRLEYVHEFPLAHYRRYPSLVQGADGYWRWPAGSCDLPLLFSVRARKEPEQPEQ